jgi:hypothetical protein
LCNSVKTDSQNLAPSLSLSHNPSGAWQKYPYR